MLQINETTVLT